MACFVRVKQSTLAVKERWGKYDEVLEPGCHFVNWLLGSKISGILSLRVKQLDVHCETKTKVCFARLRSEFPCTGSRVLANFFLCLLLFFSPRREHFQELHGKRRCLTLVGPA